jgi:hypothetical protein
LTFYCFFFQIFSPVKITAKKIRKKIHKKHLRLWKISVIFSWGQRKSSFSLCSSTNFQLDFNKDLTLRLFCGGCKGKISFLKYLQGSHEKKSISKNSLGPRGFSHKKIFPPATFEPPTKTGNKETVPKKNVENGA